MRKRTTTLQIQKAIKSNYLHLIKAEIYNKSTRKTEEIANERFLESFYYLCESGFFMDAIGWHYERDYKTGIYEIEACRMDGDSNIVITAYFHKDDGEKEEDIEEMLLKIEEEE